MTNHDLSRHLFRPANHYTGLRMQQGRTMLDSDFSEGEMLDDEDLRRVIVDVIGPHGSADRGFTITNVNTKDYNFTILAGTYYLGGMRHELLPEPAGGAGQRFRQQTDWRQSSRTDVHPPLPAAPAASRHDLVYLIGWEQVVSAVEDREFHELALGGPDTTARVRSTHRVYVRENGPADCQDAFDALVADLTYGGHSFDRANHELQSAARLTVVMTDQAVGDLCKPALPPGYTGVENQSIRIQLIAPNRLLWGFDNAAPLYRVTTSPDKQETTVQFLTTPRDQAHFPAVGQVLELLPWGARLPNGEHTADHTVAEDIGGGTLARVVTPYDPETGSVRVKIDSALALNSMNDWFKENSIPADRRFFYLRVWNPGDGVSTGPLGLTFKPGIALDLTGTGLKIRLNQEGIVGDHWIIAARPATPTEVVPWSLMTGEAPHGPRRFYCPLALLDWSVILARPPEVEVDSCRRTFRPLTRQHGCCTVTVGDGIRSFGDYTSINAAIEAIPPDQKAKICVLPGVYEERVIVQDRSNIVFEGCGGHSIIRTPPGNTTSQGLFTITNCTSITVKDLKLEATGQFGVMLYLEPITGGERSREIHLTGLDITTRRDASMPAPEFAELWIPLGSAPFPLCTVAATFVDGLRVHNCKLMMVGDLSGAPNMTIVESENVSVRECHIDTSPGSGTFSKAWGGLHIGGLCHDVAIEDCEIQYGIGSGITLGSASVASEAPFDHRQAFDPVGRFVLSEGLTEPGAGACIPVTAIPSDGGDEAAVSIKGSLFDLKIRKNRIQSMGSSGISVLGFWPQSGSATDPYEAFVTPDLVIADNIIEGNYQRPAESAPPFGYDEIVAFGGIILAFSDGLRIHDNLIAANGVNHLRPVCGVYVLHGENVTVENNQIRANGPRADGEAVDGLRAGIALQYVGRRITRGRLGYNVESDTLLPAARVRGNLVNQPAGRALQVYGLGPIYVEGNVLVSEGLGVLAAEETAGHCVDIQNIGQSPELVQQGWIPAGLGFFPAPPLLYNPGVIDEDLLDGRIMFTDNQVRFNPVADESLSIQVVNRLQSYGDVAVLDNQFFVKFQAGGHLNFDTTVVAWSTRAESNRWEDPGVEDPPGTFETDASAWTLAVMNITALNQATRCIHVDISGAAVVILNNPVNNNQTFRECDVTYTFAMLLEPPA